MKEVSKRQTLFIVWPLIKQKLSSLALLNTVFCEKISPQKENVFQPILTEHSIWHVLYRYKPVIVLLPPPPQALYRL